MRAEEEAEVRAKEMAIFAHVEPRGAPLRELGPDDRDQTAAERLALAGCYGRATWLSCNDPS